MSGHMECGVFRFSTVESLVYRLWSLWVLDCVPCLDTWSVEFLGSRLWSLSVIDCGVFGLSTAESLCHVLTHKVRDGTQSRTERLHSRDNPKTLQSVTSIVLFVPCLDTWSERRRVRGVLRLPTAESLGHVDCGVFRLSTVCHVWTHRVWSFWVLDCGVFLLSTAVSSGSRLRCL